MQDSDYIKLCVFVNADNSYGPINSIALKKLSDKDKPSISLSSNPLIRSEFAIGDVMNGDNTDKIGEYGIITIDKEVLKNITQDQFKEFINKKVVDSGLNWVSIMCFDNTAIIFNGSNHQIVTYGECSNDGIVTKPLGYLMLTTDGYEYQEATEY